MRFLLALLPLLAVASAQLDYDNDFETETGSSRVGTIPSYRRSSSSPLISKELGHELPMGVEAAIGLGALSKFDRSRISADRVGRYEVNPDFNLDGARSLDLKMTPILNFQKTNLVKGSLPTTMKIKQTKGKKIMLKLLKRGIKPSTVRKFLWAKKQGLVGVGENPVRVMFAIQRESDLDDDMSMNTETNPIMMRSTNPSLSSSSSPSYYSTVEQPWMTNIDESATYENPNTYTSFPYMQPNVDVNIPLTSSLSSPVSSSSVEHGVIIPNINLARQLQATGVVVSPTIMNQPAVEINHLKNQLLRCETIQWSTPSCVKLNELTVSLLGSSSVSNRELLHDSIVNLQNRLSLQDIDINQQTMDLDKLL